jgi:hypothetical protein
MAFVRAALSIEGVTDPLPPPVTINTPITLRLAFTDAGGAAVAADDAALAISRPDGVEFEADTADMTPEGVGIWTYTAILDQGSQWRFRAAGAGVASDDLPVTVVGSALSPPVPTGPIVVDETGLPLVAPDGGMLSLVRVDRAAPITDAAGVQFIGVQDGALRSITWELLNDFTQSLGPSQLDFGASRNSGALLFIL